MTRDLHYWCDNWEEEEEEEAGEMGKVGEESSGKDELDG